MLRRRQLLGAGLGVAAAGLLPSPARAAELTSAHWELRDLQVGKDPQVGQRFTLLVPKHVGRSPVPLLVALHGLGETHDQRLGAYAWVERYGLGSSYDRLRAPPVAPVYPKARHWQAERLAEVNRSLLREPFRGLAIACPYTPNVAKTPRGRKATLDAYAEWIVDEVIPRCRQEANLLAGAEHTYLDGCSLGGYVGIEVFLRKAAHFGAWGSVQGAFGSHRVAGYAERLADLVQSHGGRSIHLETSSGDAFREVNEALSKALRGRGVPHDFIMPPGPHNQPFLRDSGTLEMLLWHDRLPRK